MSQPTAASRGDKFPAAWTGEDGRGYDYMDFYMDACLERAGIALLPPFALRLPGIISG
jgi:hypothetical protein